MEVFCRFIIQFVFVLIWFWQQRCQTKTREIWKSAKTTFVHLLRLLFLQINAAFSRFFFDFFTELGDCFDETWSYDGFWSPESWTAFHKRHTGKLRCFWNALSVYDCPDFFENMLKSCTCHNKCLFREQPWNVRRSPSYFWQYDHT